MPVLKSKSRLFDGLVLFLFLVFSAFLMWKTFQAGPGYMKPASRVWSDFGATIPLIRSFSFGDNIPPEYPIFAGEPIRYHFVFFYLVGTFERLGLPIDWSLNIPSSLVFFAMLAFVYITGTIVFKRRSIGILSSLLLLFNGSLGFLEYFSNHSIRSFSLAKLIGNTEFTSFGPYDGKLVSAFWSLNIFTNQRHLALGYASFIALCLYLYTTRNRMSWRKSLLLGIMIGLFPFIHLAVFGMMGIALGLYFLLYPAIRKQLFVSGILSLILALPQIMYMGTSAGEISLFHIGYLVETLTIKNFLTYWAANLGLSAVLIPIGFLLATKDQRKFVLPFLSLFVVGNVLQVSSEIAANHKFFNLFAIGGNFLVALVLVRAWNKLILAKILVIPTLCLLMLTGIFDFFPIVNDRHLTIVDIPFNRTATFIYTNTPKDSVFMNSSYLYTPANLAGRKIFLGWPYFAWSAGYDTDLRADIITELYTSRSKSHICRILQDNNIDYFTTQDTSRDHDYPRIDSSFFEHEFRSIFRDDREQITIYKVSQNCNI